MSAGANTIYSPGQVSTVTASPSGGGGAPDPINDLLMKIAALKLQKAQADAKPKSSGGMIARGATTPSYSAPPKTAAQRSMEELQQAQAASAMRLIPLQEQDQVAKLQAMSGTVPTKMTTFASNANNAQMPDVMAMTGYQRQGFLPQGSSQQGDFGQAEGRQRDADAWKFQDENAQARDLRDAGDSNPWGTLAGRKDAIAMAQAKAAQAQQRAQ